MKGKTNNRRRFIKSSGLLIVGAGMLPDIPFARALSAREKLQEKEEEISPNEDLMREHGVLKRVLLAFQEVIDRICKRSGFPPSSVVDSANIIRRFIEDYHEKLEENHLFPRFKKANTLVDLVDVLTIQHQKGRIVTDRILSLAKNDFKSEEDKQQEAIDLVIETVEALFRERSAEDKVWGSMVKQALKRRKPGFDETYHGFRTFGKLLEEAQARKLLELEHDEKSGGYIIKRIGHEE